MLDAAAVCAGRSSEPPRLAIRLTAIDRASPSLLGASALPITRKRAGRATMWHSVDTHPDARTLRRKASRAPARKRASDFPPLVQPSSRRPDRGWLVAGEREILFEGRELRSQFRGEPPARWHACCRDQRGDLTQQGRERRIDAGNGHRPDLREDDRDDEIAEEDADGPIACDRHVEGGRRALDHAEEASMKPSNISIDWTASPWNTRCRPVAPGPTSIVTPRSDAPMFLPRHRSALTTPSQF
jgi:hypothetical protein